MGAGASVGEVQKAVQDASADELNAAVSDLPPGLKEKLAAALVDPPVPQFRKGQEVECRNNADEDWVPGKVVAVEPHLMIKRKEDWLPHIYAEVRSLDVVETVLADEKLDTKAGIAAKPASAKFVAANPGKLDEFYELEKKIGEGSYASVRRAKYKATGAAVAVKSISKSQMKNLHRFKQEIDIQTSLDHPTCSKLWETFEDHRNLYLVMELMVGGELFDRIIDMGHFTEKQSAVVMKQAFQAVFYLHDNSVCHRDLKPENFLFLTKDPIETSPLKLIDFGLSCYFTKDQVLATKAGTPYYVAPQVLAGKYDKACDLWALGVILYVLMCGYPPFYDESDAGVLAKVRLGNYCFNAADWRTVSEDCKHLIRLCLKMNPRDRITPEQALAHSWFDKMESSESVPADTTFLESFRQFRSVSKFQQIARQAIAMRATEADIKKLKETFLSLDINGNGTLTLDELKQAIEQAGLEAVPSDLMDLMNSVGYQGLYRINYTEFLAATIDQKIYTSEDHLWSAFRMLDKNGDGGIDLEELKKLLSEGAEDLSSEARAASEKMIAEADKNGDSKIDFTEFAGLMRAGMA